MPSTWAVARGSKVGGVEPARRSPDDLRSAGMSSDELIEGLAAAQHGYQAHQPVFVDEDLAGQISGRLVERGDALQCQIGIGGEDGAEKIRYAGQTL